MPIYLSFHAALSPPKAQPKKKKHEHTTMESRFSLLITMVTLSPFLGPVWPADPTVAAGRWKILSRNIGISAMHMALLPNDKVIVFDRTDSGPSNITGPVQGCQTDQVCYAHSVEFDPVKRTVRPLTILTDTWCSSGALSSDGELVQTGGYRTGERVVRYFRPCPDCDWHEDPNGLVSPRWYASNQVLPDGRIIVVGGRFQFSYEFIPKSDTKLYQLQFLKETLFSAKIPNNLYPFLHLSPDGNLFIFAGDRGILLDYNKDVVIRNYPVMPGGISRNYPSTGSSVLLPLVLTRDNAENPVAEILVCGGTEPEANRKADGGIFVPASRSCGRMVINSESPQWEMEEMPVGRVMGDMITLPNGDVLIVNGAAKGSAGWGVARDPVLNPVLYRFNQTGSGLSRFQVLNPSVIPRLYHSTAHLLSDGRVLVGGSNPNVNYNFTAMYPTELSLEAFYPPYLTADAPRPVITALNPDVKLAYRQRIRVEFKIKRRELDATVAITVVAPSFTTHSFAMNQRLLFLACGGAKRKTAAAGDSYFAVECDAPATSAVAPPGYYQLFVVSGGVPSRAKWIHIK
ncbi:PREDICTED: aldehyde oxidase GLOX-like [Tarenaya hassleriana]|uniref:aldehyde oxidase GLOX-like n=1 Tax=Tarenaya hassleriana TaxID=28532 RepID=UPI00053C4446|nr:PREDICTED: aldehyde oxidase GLOX-like [Tarenaya hassleriana]